ncbi:hypothetical protein IV417_06710 [Alphaproteobacteria bacterium KMM 3653]|uniref:Uncharacterized protein n=1 Tax=Harenicola maris TaxID=2841044 RepID=A0AAP2CMJ3_9RHOB|nr:hypothetical protein [Harenicola maris]
MATPPTEPQGAAPVHLLAEAEQLFTESVQALTEMIAEIKSSRAVPAREVTKRLAEVRGFAKLALEERKRVQDLQNDRLRAKDGNGTAAGTALDLATARDEVCRRLARLRAAAGSTEFPVEPE